MNGESKRRCTNICFDISLSNFKNSDNSSTEVMKRFYKVAASNHFNSGNKSVLGVGKFGVFYHVEDKKWHNGEDVLIEQYEYLLRIFIYGYFTIYNDF
jgi:hypothetical protein